MWDDSSVDMVELAKIMEMVLDVVKRHSSHSSEIFWRDVGDLGAMLFGERRGKQYYSDLFCFVNSVYDFGIRTTVM